MARFTSNPQVAGESEGTLAGVGSLPRSLPESSTIAVAMSGGVDSSAVAAMLRAEGHTLVGLTLQLWNQRRLAGHDGMPEQVQGRCCSIDDVSDARRVAAQLNIPYYLVNQQQRFEEDVIRPFVAEYLAGRTPIPCTLCNNHLKFDQLLETARAIGASHIATGHYARVRLEPTTGRWVLSRPADRTKDQTYFLFGLTQDQLAHTLFPLGELTKPVVRELAGRAGLAVAGKPDSQEICFIPGGDYSAFIQAYLAEQERAMPESSGEVVSKAGAVLGTHHGIHNFTVGQRKGIGIASPSPLYVLEINPETRQIVAGAEEGLLSRELFAAQANWIAVAGLAEPRRLEVKIRHRHEPAWAVVTDLGNGQVSALFDQPQRAMTPGQSAVFYDGDDVVGGAWIVAQLPRP